MSFQLNKIEIYFKPEIQAWEIYVLRNEWNLNEPKLAMKLGQGTGYRDMVVNKIMQPTAVLDRALAELLLEKLQETVGKHFVSKPESLLQGKLEAMEKHLEDMRKLVFRKSR